MNVNSFQDREHVIVYQVLYQILDQVFSQVQSIDQQTDRQAEVNTSVTKLCFTNFLFIARKEPNSLSFITIDLFAWSKIAILLINLVTP